MWMINNTDQLCHLSLKQFGMLHCIIKTSWLGLARMCLLSLVLSSTSYADNAVSTGIKYYTFGISETNTRNASKEELEVAFANMIRAVSSKYKVDIKIIAYENSSKLELALKNNEVQGFFGSSLDLIHNQELINQQHIFTVISSSKKWQRYLLLVRKDSGYKQLADLKGAKFVWSISDEVGLAYFSKLLNDKNLGNLDQFFSLKISKKYGGLTSTAIFFKEANVGLVSEWDYEIATELNPQLKQQLEAIDISPEFITNIIAYRNSLSEDEVLVFNEVIKVLHKNERGNKLLNMFKAHGVLKIPLKDLDNIRTLSNSKQAGGH